MIPVWQIPKAPPPADDRPQLRIEDFYDRRPQPPRRDEEREYTIDLN